MGSSPRGGPMFICDDLFFFDKQPILEADAFTKIEQRCYAPNWLQHEFFHHLYKIFPSFDKNPQGLEPTLHAWFDKSFGLVIFKACVRLTFIKNQCIKESKK